MIYDNKLPIVCIGYKQSTVTQELVASLTLYGDDENFCLSVDVITPENFLKIKNKHQYQYILGFNRDQQLRKQITKIINDKKLNCPTGIHSTVFAADKNYKSYIGQGTFIAPYCSLMMNSKIGNFCLLENYCMISHYTSIGDNVHMHPGTMIAGKTVIGNNCVFNFRSTVLNGVNICDDVEIGACGMVTKDITIPGRYVGAPARRVGDKV
jgi:acetyltransferase-like isoleucine patch superfamily enzyme